MKKKVVRQMVVVGRREVKYLIILALCVIALTASILTFKLHAGSSFAGAVCGAIGDLSQCNKVGASSYARLFGIDNSVFGMIGFSMLGYLAIYLFFRPNNLYRNLLIAGSILAGVLATYFLGVQVFILDAFCAYCVIVDLISLILLGIAVNDLAGWLKLKSYPKKYKILR